MEVSIGLVTMELVESTEGLQRAIWALFANGTLGFVFVCVVGGALYITGLTFLASP